MRPICKICKKNPCKINYRKRGFIFYKKACSGCYQKIYPSNKYYLKKWQKGKKAACEFCGFIAIDPCQLDVDHKDGNHKNNDPGNLQTLCANCHRLKSKIHKDGIHKIKAH